MSSTNWPDRIYDNHYLSKTSFGKPYGVLFSSGKYYKVAHKLALKLLHQFEFFKPALMEGLVAFEAAEFVTELDKRIGSAQTDKAQRRNDDKGAEEKFWLTFSPHQMFERNTLNVIWQVVSSSRFDSDDDPVFKKLMASLSLANRTFVVPNTILEVFPILRHIPRLTFLGPLYDCSHYYYSVFRV